MKYQIFLFLAITLGMTSCMQQSNNNLTELDKKSSREVSLSSKVVGDTIYHITSQKIWADGTLIAEKTDTIKTIKEINSWGASAPTSLIKAPIFVTVE